MLIRSYLASKMRDHHLGLIIGDAIGQKAMLSGKRQVLSEAQTRRVWKDQHFLVLLNANLSSNVDVHLSSSGISFAFHRSLVIV